MKLKLKNIKTETKKRLKTKITLILFHIKNEKIQFSI